METIEQNQVLQNRLSVRVAATLMGATALLSVVELGPTPEATPITTHTVAAGTTYHLWPRPTSEVGRYLNRDTAPQIGFPNPITNAKHAPATKRLVQTPKPAETGFSNGRWWYGVSAAKQRLGAAGLRNAATMYTVGRTHGLSASDIGCLQSISSFESGFAVNALNPTSKTFGIPQTKANMGTAGPNWKTDPATQELWEMAYTGEVTLEGVNPHYSSACNAWSFWKAHNWY